MGNMDFKNPKLLAEVMRNRAEEMLMISENFRNTYTKQLMQKIAKTYLELAKHLESI